MKSQYPSMEYAHTHTIVLEDCPCLFYLQELLGGGLTTHIPVVRSGAGLVGVIDRKRSYIQGGKGSSSVAHLFTARVIKDASPIIAAEWDRMKRTDKLDGPDPIMTSYADNVRGGCHAKLFAFVLTDNPF